MSQDKPSRNGLHKELGLSMFRLADKSLLTKLMKKKRLAFACKYKDWTPEQWRKVLFSDESSFRCFRTWPGKVRRQKNSNCYLPPYTSKAVKHLGVMVWGAFSGDGGHGRLFPP